MTLAARRRFTLVGKQRSVHRDEIADRAEEVEPISTPRARIGEEGPVCHDNH
jgi:hypothetical protein